MKRLFITFFVVCLSMPVAASDTKRAQIVELLELMNVNQTMDVVYAQMETMMTQMTSELTLEFSGNDGAQEVFARHNKRYVAMLKEELEWSKMEALMVDVYSKHLSEQEVTDMVAFYKTESGKSIMSKMPIITQDSMIATQQSMQNIVPKMMALSEQLSSELSELRQAN